MIHFSLKFNNIFLLIAVLLLLTIPMSSQEKSDSIKVVQAPKSFITNHTGVFGSKTIMYKATAKEIHLKNDKGEPIASIWSVAYTQDGNKVITKRPVSFVFNGGPGSASVWLHMGMLGPKIVKTDSDARKDDGAAPYRLVENKQGLLDITDLVFIDPVGTVFSELSSCGYG